MDHLHDRSANKPEKGTARFTGQRSSGEKANHGNKVLLLGSLRVREALDIPLLTGMELKTPVGPTFEGVGRSYSR